MKLKMIMTMAAILMLGATGFAQNYTVNTDKSVLRWTGKKIGKSHVGRISLKEGTFSIKGEKITSGKFIIDMKTIVNDDLTDPDMKAKLIGHLSSDDFFGVEQFPTATLILKSGSQISKDEATVTADLTIKGVTNPVTFTVKRMGDVFQSAVKFDRSKFNVRYGSGTFFGNLGDNAIEDEITLDVTLVTSKK